MIRIYNTKERDLDAIAEDHYLGLKKIIHKRLSRKTIPKKIREYFDVAVIHNILTAPPSELVKAELKYKKYCIKNKVKFAKTEVQKIFNYTEFCKKNKDGKWNAYSLTKRLNINSCPYCNRVRELTVEEGKEQIERPQLDHFFSQTDHPLLGVSFYNLVPCCSKCNTVHKGKKRFNVKSNIHPYLESFGNDARFVYQNTKGSLTKIKAIELRRYNYKPGKVIKINSNAKTFKIDVIYKHKSYAKKADSVLKRYNRYFAPAYKKFLKKRYSIRMRGEEYFVCFNTHWSEQQFIDDPESKLTRDILEGEGFRFLTKS